MLCRSGWPRDGDVEVVVVVVTDKEETSGTQEPLPLRKPTELILKKQKDPTFYILREVCERQWRS